MFHAICTRWRGVICAWWSHQMEAFPALLALCAVPNRYLITRDNKEQTLCISSAIFCTFYSSLQWRHNERDGVSNHRRLDCLLNCLFRHRSRKASRLRVTGLCEGNLSVTGEFPVQRISNAENVSIWWRHHEYYVEVGVFWKYLMVSDRILQQSHNVGNTNG